MAGRLARSGVRAAAEIAKQVVLIASVVANKIPNCAAKEPGNPQTVFTNHAIQKWSRDHKKMVYLRKISWENKKHREC